VAVLRLAPGTPVTGAGELMLAATVGDGSKAVAVSPSNIEIETAPSMMALEIKAAKIPKIAWRKSFIAGPL
jgi:hypothetical protein